MVNESSDKKYIGYIINLYPAYYIYSSKQQISYSPYEFCMIFIQQFCPLINNDYKLLKILTRHHKKRRSVDQPFLTSLNFTQHFIAKLLYRLFPS